MLRDAGGTRRVSDFDVYRRSNVLLPVASMSLSMHLAAPGTHFFDKGLYRRPIAPDSRDCVPAHCVNPYDDMAVVGLQLRPRFAGRASANGLRARTWWTFSGSCAFDGNWADANANALAGNFLSPYNSTAYGLNVTLGGVNFDLNGSYVLTGQTGPAYFFEAGSFGTGSAGATNLPFADATIYLNSGNPRGKSDSRSSACAAAS